MIDLKEKIWIEKYRPKEIKNVIGQHTNKIINFLKKSKLIPHFLLYSKSPGTGKTSMGLAIIKNLGCDSLILNSSDDRKIETIRNKIKIFVTGMSSKENIKRAVLLDEMDGMMKTSQDALKRIMEEFSNNCFFIITANSIEKIIQPIQSRCVCLDLSKPHKEEILKYLKNICLLEKIKNKEEDLNKLIKRHYPDIRNCVQFLQEVKNDGGNLSESTNKYLNKYEEVFRLILDKKFGIIKNMIFDGDTNPREFNNWLFKRIIKVAGKNLSFNQVKKILFILADNERDFAYGAGEDIIFVANLLKIIEIIKE